VATAAEALPVPAVPAGEVAEDEDDSIPHNVFRIIMLF